MVYQQIVRQWDLLSNVNHGLFDEARLHFGIDWEEFDDERSRAFRQIPDFDNKVTKQLKQLSRDGIPHSQRRRWWLVASGGLKLLTQVGDVWKSAKKAASNIKPSNDSKFGGAVDILTFLPPAMSRKLYQFLHVLWTQNQGIDHSPLIPTVSALLLLYMEVPLAYLTIQSMINKSRQDSWYFTLTKEQFLASAQAFGELAEKRCPSITKHAESLHLNIAQIGLSFFPVFFLPFMPLPVALILLDSFMIEGRKVLYRFCLNLLIQEKKNLSNATSARSFITVLINAMERLNNVSSLKTFLKNSFKIFLSRSRHINQIEAHAIAMRSGLVGSIYDHPELAMVTNNPIMRSFSNDRIAFTPGRVSSPSSFPAKASTIFSFSNLKNNDSLLMMQQHIVNRVLPEIVGGRLLTDALYYALRQNLPTVLTRYSVNLVFSTSVNGFSFIELFNACRDETPYILVVQTTNGLYGAMLSDPPRPDKSPGDGIFYGTPLCFVFNGQTQEIYNNPHPPNNLFMCADEHALIVGGPEPAISIKGGMKIMESFDCATYGSPSFASCVEGDSIIEIELYTLVAISISSPPIDT